MESSQSRLRWHGTDANLAGLASLKCLTAWEMSTNGVSMSADWRSSSWATEQAASLVKRVKERAKSKLQHETVKIKERVTDETPAVEHESR